MQRRKMSPEESNRARFREVVEAYKKALVDNEIGRSNFVFDLAYPQPATGIDFQRYNRENDTGMLLKLQCAPHVLAVFPEEIRVAPGFKHHSDLLAMTVRWPEVKRALHKFPFSGHMELYSPKADDGLLVSFSFSESHLVGERFLKQGVMSCWPNLQRNILYGDDPKTAVSYIAEIFAELKRDLVIQSA